MGSFAEALRATQAVAPSTTPAFAAVPPEERGGEGIFGFVGNFGADIGDLVGGLYRFIGTGVSEAITQPTNVLKELVTGGFADTPVNVLTPAILPKMAMGIVDDVKDRYLEGDIGQELYDHPLSFLLDATAVAGAAGTAARVATGTGAIYGRLGKALLGAERVARNAELLEGARALRVARASEDVAKVAEITSKLGGEAKTALWFDRLVTHPLPIADPRSGATFDIMPTRNPLVSAVWSEPVRRKYFLEGIGSFEQKVVDLRRVVDETADIGSQRQLASMEAALERMKASGAQYVANKKYGTILARRKLQQSTDSLLGRLQLRGVIERRERREALRTIIRTSGVSGETLDNFHQVLEGLDDGMPVSMSPEVLQAQLAEKGFASLEEAADAMLRQDPIAAGLDVDEKTSLTALVTRGEIDPLRPFREDVDRIIGEKTGVSEIDADYVDSGGKTAGLAEGTDRRIERLDELFQQAQDQELESFTDLGEGVIRYQRPGADRSIYLAVEDEAVQVPTAAEWRELDDKRLKGATRPFGYEEPGFFGRSWKQADGKYAWSAFQGTEAEPGVLGNGTADTLEDAQRAAKQAIDEAKAPAAPRGEFRFPDLEEVQRGKKVGAFKGMEVFEVEGEWYVTPKGATKGAITMRVHPQMAWWNDMPAKLRKAWENRKPKPAAPAAAVPEMETITERHVVGYRDTLGTEGHVMHTATRSDMRRRGIGERLHRAHWNDIGIDNPDKIRQALGMNTFTPEAAELNRKMANAYADATQATYHDVLETLRSSPRRRRVIEQVQDISQSYPDGRAVRQTVKDPANLRRLAVESADNVGTRLRQVFGAKSVKIRLKAEARIRKLTEEGSRVLDALGARVIVDNWQGVPRAVAALEDAGLEIVGVEDLRRVPGSGGARGTRAYVRDPENGLIAEVEFGTPLFDRFRDATAAHDRKVSEVHRDLRRARALVEEAQAGADSAAGTQALEEHVRLVEELEAETSAADRYMEGHYEMLADEIALQHGRAIPDTETRSLMNEMRLWVARYLEQPLVENGYFDFLPAFERLYLPGKLKSGAHWSEEAGDFVGGESAYALDDARAAAGLPMPVYFGHIENPGAIHDFIAPRGTQGVKKLAENRMLRRSRGALFEQGTYITDIEEAYSRRAARAIRMRDTYEMVAEVAKRVGRSLESADDLAEGEAIMAPQFLQSFVRMSIGIEDRLGALMSQMDDADLVGAVADLNPKLAREMAPDILAEGIRGALGIGEREAGALFLAVSAAIPAAQRQLLAVSTKGLELYAVPKIVADRLRESSRWSLGPGAKIAWDKPTQLWRAMTLYGRPAWVVNNILGNITFAKIGGVRLREVVKTAIDKDYRFYVDELARVYGNGDVEQGWFSSLDTYTPQLGAAAEETLSGRAVAAIEAKGRSSRLLRPARKYADWIKRVNTEVENAFRRVGFVEGLRKTDVYRDVHRTARGFWGSKEELQRILQDGVSPKQASDAMDNLNTWFGDYSSMGPMERQVVRRFIFPFWGFYRHMGKLLVKLPFDYPSKMAVIRSMSLVDRDLREEYGAVPEWMDGMVPFGPLSSDGMQRFLSTSGPNPFNAFMDIGLGLFHPAIKATVEMMTGRDAYTGREFSDPDVFTPFGSTQRYRIIRGPDGVPTDAVPIDKVTPSLPVELLSQIPQYDWLRAAAAGGKPYDTSGVLESAAQGPLTNANGEPVAPFNPADFAARSLGASFFNYDIESFRQRQAQERENALTQAYERWAETRVGSPPGVG